MKKVFLSVALIAMATPTFAADTGGYLGLALGRGHSQDAENNVNNLANQLAFAGASSGGSFDEYRGALGIFGGYRFAPNIAAEVGYVNFGTYHLSGIASGSGGTVAFTEEDKITALYVAAVGSLPINNQFSLFGKLGMASTKNEETCTVTGTFCSSASDTGTHPVYGIGANVTVAPNIGLGLEYDVFQSVGNKDNEYTAGDFSFFHINATLNF